MSESVPVTVYSPQAARIMRTDQIRDSLSYTDPEVVIVPETHHEYSLKEHTDDVTVTVINSNLTYPTHIDCGPVDIVICSAPDHLEQIADMEGDRIDTSTETFLISDALSVEINATELKAELKGSDAYLESLPHGLNGSYTHLTAGANPGYRKTWEGLDVQGIMPGANKKHGQSSPEIVELKLHDEGFATANTVSHDRFGLRGVTQVAQSRAEKLRSAGVETSADLADADLAKLQDIDGIGSSIASTMVDSAQALHSGTIIRQGDEQLPNREPVFIDIETDGLSPSMVWLIGVLDRESDPEYRAFLSKDPDDKGKAVTEFISWLQENAQGRPVVAYNGKNFDFPVLTSHINQHCPTYIHEWEDWWKLDPLFWAVTQSNAMLPGRTNKLDDVASALGWESSGTGLDGATVGRQFRRYLEDPCQETALDWNRHQTYCEDDVRSMAFVYDEIAKTRRTQSGRSETQSQSDNTAQGTLTDF